MPPGAAITSDGVRHGPQMSRVGGAEDDHHGKPEGGGHVGRAGIVAHEEGRAGQQILDFAERRAAEGAEFGEGRKIVGRRRR